ncbi:hypothetical protein MN608_09584 [Microdochium nivale]|nr:hypothetical protein MN608_09584 [Microdochium nivale]
MHSTLGADAACHSNLELVGHCAESVDCLETCFETSPFSTRSTTVPTDVHAMQWLPSPAPPQLPSTHPRQAAPIRRCRLIRATRVTHFARPINIRIQDLIRQRCHQTSFVVSRTAASAVASDPPFRSSTRPCYRPSPSVLRTLFPVGGHLAFSGDFDARS